MQVMHIGRSLLPKQWDNDFLWHKYTYTHTHIKWIKENYSLHWIYKCKRIYIYICKTVCCLDNIHIQIIQSKGNNSLQLFWFVLAKQKLNASWLSHQFRQAQGCRSGTEHYLPWQWPSDNSMGWFWGIKGKGQPQCQTPDQAEKLSASDFFCFSKVFRFITA